MVGDDSGKNKDVIDILSRKNKENIFYIMGLIELVYANSYNACEGKDVQENLEENKNYLDELVSFFREFIDNEKIEGEFIHYAKEHFNLEFDGKLHEKEIIFESDFEIDDEPVNKKLSLINNIPKNDDG